MRSSMFRPALAILLGLSGAAMAQDAGNAAPQQTPATTPATPADAAPATRVTAPAATSDTAPAETAAPAPAADAAPAVDASGMIAAPPAGKSQIVFFREKKFTGAAIRFKVREGDTELGKLSNGVYFVVPVDPGTHTYTVHSEAKDVLTLEVEAGETYYVKGSVSMGFLAGHPNLSPSDETSFDALAKKLERTQ